jgi:ABC-type nitrate/sulfonate/bicarbonate transport system ATPase subunit
MFELRIPAGTHGVLGAITTSVSEGDRICLLGPSGVGKTTLLNHLAGLNPVARGSASSVRLAGRPPGLRVGYLFQEHRLLPWRTLRQNLMLVGVASRDAGRLLEQVGLGEYVDHLPDQLSLGMARRAALARCLGVNPDLLLLDEPFASLDPDRAEELQALIIQLLEAHPAMAMICVTHELRDAHRLANRVWYLDGRPACLRCDAPLQRDQASVDALSRRLRELGRLCRPEWSLS